MDLSLRCRVTSFVLLIDAFLGVNMHRWSRTAVFTNVFGAVLALLVGSREGVDARVDREVGGEGWVRK